jgi:hypothetical protein
MNLMLFQRDDGVGVVQDGHPLRMQRAAAAAATSTSHLAASMHLQEHSHPNQ